MEKINIRRVLEVFGSPPPPSITGRDHQLLGRLRRAIGEIDQHFTGANIVKASDAQIRSWLSLFKSVSTQIPSGQIPDKNRFYAISIFLIDELNRRKESGR